MQVKSIAECSNTFDHLSLSIFEWLLQTGYTILGPLLAIEGTTKTLRLGGCQMLI